MTRLAMRSAIPLAFLAVLAVAGQVRAAGEVATQISIRPLDPVFVGDGDALIDLRVAGGPVLANEPVELSIDGAYYRRTRTDADGLATIGLPENLTVGEHRLTAVYPGSTDRYAPASTSAVLTVVPYELTIQTVPSLPGLAFTLDGKRFEADADGIARIAVGTVGDHQLAVLPDEYDVGGAQVDFARWLPDNYGTEITVNVPRVGHIQAGFDVYLPVSQVFLDPAGGRVEDARVTSFTLRSSLGNVFNFPDGRERLYKASRVVRRSGGLESVDVRYNVTEVEVDGSNVVNAGQQRFYATPGATWRISLLLYSARVQSKDALFGFGAGQTVEVTFPNGKVETFQAQDGAEVVIPWLARGIYRMTVADAPGWAPSMPVALSRDQEVELRVVSFVDMFIGVTLFLGIVFGLLHRGRPHLIPETMRAAGRGASRVGIPVPAAVRAASQPPAEAEPAASIQVADGEPHPGIGQAQVSSRLAPILATIASPDPYPDRALPLDITRSPQQGSRQVSEALLHMAPGLLGPVPAGSRPRPQPAPTPRPVPVIAGPPPAPVTLPAAVPVPDVPATAPAAAPPTRRRPAQRRAAAAHQAAGAPAETEAPVAAARRAPRPKAATKRSRGSAATKATAKPKAASKAKAAPKPKAASKAKAAPKPKAASKAKATAKPSNARAKAAAKPTATATASAAAKKTTARSKATAKPRAASKARTTAAAKATATSKAKTTGAPRTTAARRRGSRSTDAVVTQRTGAAPEARRSQLSELGIRDPGQPSPKEAMQRRLPEAAVPVQSCRNCGLELWVGAQFCRRCGQPSVDSGALEIQPVAATNARPPRATRAARTEAEAAVAANSGPDRGARGSKRGPA